MYSTGNDGYLNFLVLVLMISSIVLGSKRKAANWISNKMPFKPFDTNLELTMPNLANLKI